MRIEDESCIYRIMTTEVSQDAEIRDGRGRDGETWYNKDSQIEEEDIGNRNKWRRREEERSIWLSSSEWM